MGHDQPPAAHVPARVLGPFDALCVVVGAIVGVGIFFNPASMAALVGDGGRLLLAWGVAGVIALCGAFTFAELGGREHGPGAQYTLLRQAFGRPLAFVFVFCNATAVQAGAIGAIALVCVSNLWAALGRSGQPPGPVLLGLASTMIVLLTLANVVGVRWGSRIQNATVVCKLVALGVVVVLALVSPEAPPATPALAPAHPPLAPVPGVLASLVPALFALGGWQQALWISGEVRNPARTLPHAIIGGVVLVVIVYLAANWAYLHLLGGWRGVAASRALAADAVSVRWPGFGARMIAGAVCVSAAGVLNAQLLTGPRLLHSMALDGRFFAPFGRISARFGTPWASVLLLGGLALGLLLLAGPDGLNKLVNGVVCVDSVFFVLTGCALFVLRRQSVSQGYAVPWYPIVPAVFVLGEVGVVVGAHLEPESRVAALIGLGWVVGAGLVYAVFFRNARAARAG